MDFDKAPHTSLSPLNSPVVNPYVIPGSKNKNVVKMTALSIRGDVGLPNNPPFSLRNKEFCGRHASTIIATYKKATRPALFIPRFSSGVMVVNDTSSSPTTSPLNAASLGSTILSVTQVPKIVTKKVDAAKKK